MNKMTILFPGSYMNYRVIDDDMAEEYHEALETGLFNILLFNYDHWVAGETLKITKQEDISETVIYRGWMLKPEQYKQLYDELNTCGIHLLMIQMHIQICISSQMFTPI